MPLKRPMNAAEIKYRNKLVKERDGHHGAYEVYTFKYVLSGEERVEKFIANSRNNAWILAASHVREFSFAVKSIAIIEDE